jgi:hypothetical protein
VRRIRCHGRAFCQKILGDYAVAQHVRRVVGFSVEDFDLLQNLISGFGKIVSTPHVLAQVSDLTDLPGKDLQVIREVSRATVELLDEWHDPSRALVTNSLFPRLGLTDAAIAAVCDRGTLVLTADVELQLALQQRGADALNFNHVRQIGWKH